MDGGQINFDGSNKQDSANMGHFSNEGASSPTWQNQFSTMTYANTTEGSCYVYHFLEGKVAEVAYPQPSPVKAAITNEMEGLVNRADAILPRIKLGIQYSIGEWCKKA
ncbi:uncharacterized protein VTP21DRAFT_3126 [Calcarisporiella thermophila]|uniref:uncharacterized protein n=1 Tax=Calcarisporiella thermophila TaxID=911321 RepID=UPI0037433488